MLCNPFLSFFWLRELVLGINELTQATDAAPDWLQRVRFEILIGKSILLQQPPQSRSHRSWLTVV